MLIKIESIYGTCLWLIHAGVRANNPKLTRAANRVFSSLFHIMGNLNYSQIELYDAIVIESARKYRPELCQNLEKNEGTNLSNLPFSAQSNDARHEEYNKKVLL